MREVTTITKAAERLGITEELLAEKEDIVIATELAGNYGKSSAGFGGSDYSISCDRQYVYLDKHEEFERKYPWLQFVKNCRLVIGERTALIAAKDGDVTALRVIEVRIHAHLQTAYSSVLEVGRCLIEAKDSGLVPHRQWEAWVREHAHMSERSAQKLMKAAREVPAGSIMEGLDISKVQEILALPEPEREAMAERALEEDMTVKQLREAVATEKRRSEQLMNKYNQANSRRLQVEQTLEHERIRRRGWEEQKRAEAEDKEREHQREIGALRLQLEEALSSPSGISPEAQARIDRLEEELKEAEEIAEHQAELRQRTQDALEELQSREARGGQAPQEDLTAEAVITSVRTFIGCVGYVPHMRLMALSGAERQAVAAHAEMVAKWAEGVREALATGEPYVIEGA